MAKQENEVQRNCLKLLAAMRIPCWRSNQIPAMTASGRFKKFAGMKGVPDILGLLPPDGRWLGVECKSLTGRQRPEQKAFQEMVEKAGGLYLLVRSVGELQDALRGR